MNVVMLIKSIKYVFMCMKKRSLSFDEIDSIISIDEMLIDYDAEPTLYGVGIVDVDFNISVHGKHCRQYQVWVQMLSRCYNKEIHKKHPTYANCSVSDKWKRFSNFLVWCNNQICYSFKDMKGNSFALDKDVLIKGNKIYSSRNCSFIPQAVNLLLVKCDGKRGEYSIGVCLDKVHDKYLAKIVVDGEQKTLGRFDTELEAFNCYKAAKEAECKRVANVYRDYISDAVYKALMKYEVSIDD